MNASQVVFYLLSILILGAGVLSVTAKKIFRSAIWLLFSLIGIAGLFFWMNMNFLAAVQIIVYVGGIVVLIIFSIFLTQQAGNEMAKPAKMRLLVSFLAVLTGFVFTYFLLATHPFRQPSSGVADASVENIGTQLLSITDHGYVLPFEVVSILLLAAMIGCIVIAMKTETGKK